MEITLEMVERLKEKADVSYAQAKQALEYSGGNLLDALIYLEEQGVIPRCEGAYFSSKGKNNPPPPEPQQAEIPVPPDEKQEKKGKQGKSVTQRPKGVRRNSPFITLRRWLIDNELEIWRKEQPVTALPVLILILLVMCAYYVVIPVLVLGLFLGFRYRFSGPDLERDDLNGVMDSVADTASDLGHKVMEELKHDWHSDEKDK